MKKGIRNRFAGAEILEMNVDRDPIAYLDLLNIRTETHSHVNIPVDVWRRNARARESSLAPRNFRDFRVSVCRPGSNVRQSGHRQ